MPELAGPAAVRWGSAARITPGEAASGDLAVVRTVERGTLFGVVDGAGHGREAARAAAIARDVLDDLAGAPLPRLVRACHDALASSRGVAMGIAFVPERAAQLTWLGVGRVHAAVLRGDGLGPRRERWLCTAGGEAGQVLPDLRPDDVDLERGDLLVLATDGVRATFAEFLGLAGSPQDIARRIVERSWTETDDAVALVARYLGPTW